MPPIQSTTPFLVKDELEFIDKPNGELSIISAYKIRTRNGQLFRMDQLYGEAFEFALGATRSDNGNYQMFPASNDNGSGKQHEHLRFIVPSNPSASLLVARIIMDAKPGKIIQRIDSRNNYTVANLKERGGQSTHNTRPLLLDVVKELAGADVSRELNKKLLEADAMHRSLADQTTYEVPSR